MKEESQQDKDIANPPLPLTELAAKTEVGKIGMEFSKVESSLSTIIFSEEKSRLTNSKLGGIGYLPKDESYRFEGRICAAWHRQLLLWQ